MSDSEQAQQSKVPKKKTRPVKTTGVAIALGGSLKHELWPDDGDATERTERLRKAVGSKSGYEALYLGPALDVFCGANQNERTDEPRNDVAMSILAHLAIPAFPIAGPVVFVLHSGVKFRGDKQALEEILEWRELMMGEKKTDLPTRVSNGADDAVQK